MAGSVHKSMDNLHSYSFIEFAKYSSSNNMQGSNCTVNAQIITNIDLVIQKINSSETNFYYVTILLCFQDMHYWS